MYYSQVRVSEVLHNFWLTTDCSVQVRRREIGTAKNELNKENEISNEGFLVEVNELTNEEMKERKKKGKHKRTKK